MGTVMISINYITNKRPVEFFNSKTGISFSVVVSLIDRITEGLFREVLYKVSLKVAEKAFDGSS